MASKKTAKKKASVKAPAKKTARKLKTLRGRRDSVTSPVRSTRKAKKMSAVAGRKIRVGALTGQKLGTSGGRAKTRKVNGKIRSASR